MNSGETAAGSAPLLAVGDVHDDLTPLVDRLRAIVAPFDATTDEAQALRRLERQEPLVLGLAYSRLELALMFYLRALKKLSGDRTDLLQTIVFCDRTEAHKAFDLCRDGVIDDYLVTRPIYDSWQLALAIKHARDRLRIKRWMLDVTAIPPERKGIAQCVADLEAAVSARAPRDERLQRAMVGVRLAVDALTTHLEEGTRLVEQARLTHADASGRSLATPSSPPPAPATLAPSRVKSPVVLVIDDDEFTRHFVARTLESGGYTAVAAEDGPRGLAALAAGPVDLVLMDIEMPGLSGIETTKRLRERWPPEKLPVIMLTGHGERESVIGAIDAGASDFIVKPCSRTALLAKVADRLVGLQPEGRSDH
jgi:CheY-like chemotaxis protein